MWFTILLPHIQRQKLKTQEQSMHYENAKKFEDKKVLIYISLFSKETPNLQTRRVAST